MYRAFYDDEQLFDLVNDPGERMDVSNVDSYASVLATWRAKLVRQFEDEGRGTQWVSNGHLVRREQGQTYSPNYPSATEVALSP